MGSPAPRVGNPDPKVGKGTRLRVQEDCGPGTEKRRRRIGEDILLGFPELSSPAPVSCCFKSSCVVASQKRRDPRDRAQG